MKGMVGTSPQGTTIEVQAQRKATTHYLVQERRALLERTSEGSVERAAWVDLVTVSVPARSHRKSAITAALEMEGRELEPGVVFRVLDETAAGEICAVAETPPPPPPPAVRLV